MALTRMALAQMALALIAPAVLVRRAPGRVVLAQMALVAALARMALAAALAHRGQRDGGSAVCLVGAALLAMRAPCVVVARSVGSQTEANWLHGAVVAVALVLRRAEAWRQAGSHHCA